MWVESKLHRGEVIAKVDLPMRNPPKETLLRIRVPDGWRVLSANVNGTELSVDEKGTANISSLRGKATIHFQVKPI
jgi:hypothetical protein